MSPDGALLAYPNGRAGVYVGSSLDVATDAGTNVHDLWNFIGQPEGTPAWNPAGTELAITIAFQPPSSFPPSSPSSPRRNPGCSRLRNWW